MDSKGDDKRLREVFGEMFGEMFGGIFGGIFDD
jgi:hypothetical protein